jgi:hypothetical protein
MSKGTASSWRRMKKEKIPFKDQTFLEKGIEVLRQAGLR